MDFIVSYPVPYRKYLLLTGFIGLLASILVGAGEFLVHYAGGAMHDSVPYAFFQAVPAWRLPVGHYLMIAGLPLYFIGYMHLFLALQPGSRPLASGVFVLGVFSFAIGGIWVGSRAFMGSLVQILQEHPDPSVLALIIQSYDLLLENLVQILRVLVFANSVVFAVAILRSRTLYPRWMALFNPIALLLVVFLLFLKVPTIGDYLVPTAMNVAHFVMFSVSLLALRQPTPEAPAA